jgi:ketosteroid isomerase-like protein
MTSTLADRLELLEVYSRYAIGMDRGDRDTFASAWADDAVWICTELNQNLVGKDAILAYFDGGPGKAATLPAVGGNLRLCGNQVLDIDGDSATGRAEFIAFRYTAGAMHPYTMGHYVDRFVRTPQGWRIAHRDMVIAPIVPAPSAS